MLYEQYTSETSASFSASFKFQIAYFIRYWPLDNKG